MNRWVGLALLLITGGALALRSPQLALRPLHNDEAVNALKIQELWEEGRYAYDPNEHHGPTLYYATLPFLFFGGAPDVSHISERHLRAVPVFFSLLLILLLWPLTAGLGRAATVVAALFTAASPAMVYYSRDYIHEMLLVWSTLLVIIGGWRYSQSPRLGWAVLAGSGLGLMYSTKETFVLALAAMIGALSFCVIWRRWSSQPVNLRQFWNTGHALIAGAAAALVALLFFTSFFTNASGPLDSVRTYLPWLKRAGGDSPHIHPWYFYLQRLFFFKEARGPVWSEGLILVLALVGVIAAFSRKHLDEPRTSLVRFLAVYTLLLTTAYSLIAYKTPWCLLGFYHGMILLAGVGTVTLFRWARQPLLQTGLAFLLVAGAAHLTWQAWRASYAFASDRRNPYVYAQTLPNFLNLVEKVRGLAKVHPAGQQMLIKVMAPDSDYWPLPWYLRDFKQVGWWGHVTSDPYAPVMIVGAGLHAALDEKSNKNWLMVNFFELRPKTFLELYVEFGLWEKYVLASPPPPDEP